MQCYENNAATQNHVILCKCDQMEFVGILQSPAYITTQTMLLCSFYRNVITNEICGYSTITRLYSYTDRTVI